MTLLGLKPHPSTYPQALNTLGDWIRKTRLDLGLFQTQVADRFGVDESTITNWELNRSEPEIRYIPMIIEFIGYCPYVPTTNLVERVEQVRWALGLSRKQLAALVQTDESNFTKWLMGLHRPTEKSLKRIESFLSKAATQCLAE